MKKLISIALSLCLCFSLLVGCANTPPVVSEDFHSEKTPEARANKLLQVATQNTEKYNSVDIETLVNIDLPLSSGSFGGYSRMSASLRSGSKSASIYADGALTIKTTVGSTGAYTNQEIYYDDGIVYLSSGAGGNIIPSICSKMSYEDFLSFVVYDQTQNIEPPPSIECESVNVVQNDDGKWNVKYTTLKGEILEQYIKIASSFVNIEKLLHFTGANLSITYNEDIVPIEISSELIFSNVAGTTNLSSITIYSTYFYFNTEEKAIGTQTIIKEAYKNVESLGIVKHLCDKIDNMFLGKEDTVSLKAKTVSSSPFQQKNSNIDYALVITNLLKSEFELTKYISKSSTTHYTYEFKKIKSTEKTSTGWSKPKETDANASEALKTIKDIVDPITFSIFYVSEIVEKENGYIVYLDDYVLSLIGINMAKKYDGSEVYYEFDLVDGEVKNLSLHIDVKYYGDTRYEADYTYYDGVNPSAPPLKP